MLEPSFDEALFAVSVMSSTPKGKPPIRPGRIVAVLVRSIRAISIPIRAISITVMMFIRVSVVIRAVMFVRIPMVVRAVVGVIGKLVGCTRFCVDGTVSHDVDS